MLKLLQMHSGGTSPKGDQPSAEAKVLKAEENASRLAASFMMKAAVTKALHEEQASIVQVRSFCNSQNPIMSRHTTSQAPFVSCGSGSLKAIYSDIVLFVAVSTSTMACTIPLWLIDSCHRSISANMRSQLLQHDLQYQHKTHYEMHGFGGKLSHGCCTAACCLNACMCMQLLHLMLPVAYCCLCHYALLLDPLDFAAGVCASCKAAACLHAG